MAIELIYRKIIHMLSKELLTQILQHVFRDTYELLLNVHQILQRN